MNARMTSAIVLAVTLSVAVPALAQTHPDLSGTWTIDAARGDSTPAAPAARGNAGGGRG